MIEVSANDDALTGLEGEVAVSSAQPEITYRLQRALGAGTFAVAFYAIREAPDGQSPVVLKVMRPHLVSREGEMASLIAEKERIALQRLRARVPPTPFVVELLDADLLPVVYGGGLLRLPWLALEYVHGGAEGTTLEERIDFCVERTGYAFEAERAAHALRCLAAGIEAVHDVGVVHRDLTTWNVLCCGFGAKEVFKISDFGIARPEGYGGTFIGSPGGTAGFAPPEQVLGQKDKIGPASDVFSLASIVYRMLTADHYFPASSTIDGVVLTQRPQRRRLVDGALLTPELRGRPETCAAIDRVLAAASRLEPSERLSNCWDLARPIIDALEGAPASTRAAQRLSGMVAPESRRGAWVWRARHFPGDQRFVRSVSWDSDGSCLVATAEGLEFWDGTSWRTASTANLPYPQGIRFVHRAGPGAWLVGGDRATIARYSPQGVVDVVAGADPSVTFIEASGDLKRLAVLVGERNGEAPVLFPRARGHWIEPVVLKGVARVAAIARIEEDRWLVCGGSQDGHGFAAIYAPLRCEVRRLTDASTGLLTSASTQPDLGVGVAVGEEGRSLRIVRGHAELWAVRGGENLTAVAVDPSGRAYAASQGRIWLQYDSRDWSCVWRNASWSAPFASLLADVGLVIGMTADGGVVEGRWEDAASQLVS